ncbi:MAG: OmpA family protein [Pontibacterium sp.]
MNNRFKLVTLVPVVVFLAACSSLQQEAGGVKDTAPNKPSKAGTLFERYLSEGYHQHASREDREHDFADSDWYLERAERSAAGRLVVPELLENRDIPVFAIEELTQARNRLDEAFYRGGSVKVPREAAHAQVMFDCWMEQQEEDIQPHHIEECKSGFFASISQIESVLGTKKASACVDQTIASSSPEKEIPVSAPVAKTQVKKRNLPAYNEPYIVYFDLKSSDLTVSALTVIREAAADAARSEPEEIIISGHTDSSGSKTYNEGLSKRRVLAVMDALRLGGISAEMIDGSHYGEEKQLISTGDGVRHAQNRRVEIEFK